MGERPTPEEIAEYWGGTSLLTVLRQEGYVLVHPDDVPVGDWIDWPADRNHGWNLCRDRVFNLNAD